MFPIMVVGMFGPRYLREPTVADTEKLMTMFEARGWPLCSDLLIACTRDGRVDQKLYKGNIRPC